MLLNNEEAIKAQVLYILSLHKGNVFRDAVVVDILASVFTEKSVADIAKSLEAVIATAQAALRTIDEMREPPMDLKETAGVEPKDDAL